MQRCDSWNYGSRCDWVHSPSPSLALVHNKEPPLLDKACDGLDPYYLLQIALHPTGTKTSNLDVLVIVDFFFENDLPFILYA